VRTLSRSLVLFGGLVVGLGGLGACGDTASPLVDDPTPPTEPPPPTGPVSAVIGPDGGSLSATTDQGTVVTLVVPAGAVAAPTPLTVRPLQPFAGLWAAVALEPVGAIFRQPFTVTFALPEGAELESPRLSLHRSAGVTPLATTVNLSARTLSTSALRFFGFVPEMSQGVQATDGFTAAPARSSHGGGGTPLGAGSMTCAQMVSAGEATFNAAMAGGDFQDAVAAALALGAALADAACYAEASEWATRASEAGCAGMDALLDRIRQTPITGYGQHEAESAEVMGWASLLQLLQDACSPPWATVLEEEIDDFLAFVGQRLDALDGVDYPGFLDLRDEARQLRTTMTRAMQLGFSDFAQSVESEALFPVLARMRDVAFDLCRTEGWHYPLSRLTPTGFFAGRDIIGVPAPRPGPEWPAPGAYAQFTETDIYRDLQFCGTDVSLVSVVASGGDLETREVGTSGTPGQVTDEVQIPTPTRGKLQLEGDLFAMSCWHEAPADHEIAVFLGGAEVHTLSRPQSSRYLEGEPLELEIADIAEAAGVTPKEGSQTTLRIVRRRDACDDDIWGPREFTLLDADLEWKNPTLEVEVTVPDVVTPGAEIEAEVRVKVIDQLNEAGFFDAIDVVLEVEGGTALEAAGQTDTEGFFRSRIQVADAPDVAADGATAGQLSVTAVATSFEEVTATGSITVVPGTCPLPPSWAVAEIVDATWFTGDLETITLGSTTVDFTSISLAASARVAEGDSWSASYHPSYGITDYLLVVPTTGWPADGKVIVQVQHEGRAEAFRNSSDDAEVNGGLMRKSVRVSTYQRHGEVVVDEFQGIEDITFTPQTGWASMTGWVGGRVRNNRRHRNQTAPYYKLDYAVSVVGVVDSNGLSVPAQICTASGVQY
jgi:hypothetical protein